MEKLDPEVLKRWTTASLVVKIAQYASGGGQIARGDAELCAVELNARIPPRVMPTTGT